jgi:hypothetical protein
MTDAAAGADRVMAGAELAHGGNGGMPGAAAGAEPGPGGRGTGSWRNRGMPGAAGAELAHGGRGMGGAAQTGGHGAQRGGRLATVIKLVWRGNVSASAAAGVAGGDGAWHSTRGACLKTRHNCRGRQRQQRPGTRAISGVGKECDTTECDTPRQPLCMISGFFSCGGARYTGRYSIPASSQKTFQSEPWWPRFITM